MPFRIAINVIATVLSDRPFANVFQSKRNQFGLYVPVMKINNY